MPPAGASPPSELRPKIPRSLSEVRKLRKKNTEVHERDTEVHEQDTEVRKEHQEVRHVSIRCSTPSSTVSHHMERTSRILSMSSCHLILGALLAELSQKPSTAIGRPLKPEGPSIPYSRCTPPPSLAACCPARASTLSTGHAPRAMAWRACHSRASSPQSSCARTTCPCLLSSGRATTLHPWTRMSASRSLYSSPSTARTPSTGW